MAAPNYGDEVLVIRRIGKLLSSLETPAARLRVIQFLLSGETENQGSAPNAPAAGKEIEDDDPLVS